MITMSYSILTHNETESLQKLLDFLLEKKDDCDEIVILDDYSDNERTQEILDVYTSIHEMKFERRRLLKDFGGQKNYLKRMCTKDYIFNLDADEIPTFYLMRHIKTVLEDNPKVDAIYVPRVNTVEGITETHIQKWGWNMNDKGWINFPDWQLRIHKNIPNIKWKNKVHETLEGFMDYSYLPDEERWAIVHKKDIEKQEQQNEFYEGI
tara:strand:- start:122 stop:745 length:624 start_codon:yes stop_codon:yes gene_type:complete